MRATLETGSRFSHTILRWFLFVSLAISLFVMVFVLHARLSPAVHPVGTDSGVFLYTGQRILAGDVLYRDVWDHKPPGIHILNALALRLVGETPWAMWWMEVVWVTLSTVVLLVTMARITNVRLGIGAAFMYLGTMHLPHLLRDFNFTETFAQLPQFLIVLSYVRFLQSGKMRWVTSLGVLVSVTFAFRQTDIGLGLIFFALILTTLRNGKMRRRAAIAFAAGGLMIPLAAVIYWGNQSALADLWSGVFGYNLDYASASNVFVSVFEAIEKLSSTYPLMMLFGMAVGLLLSRLVPICRMIQKRDQYINKRATDQVDIGSEPVDFLEIGISLALPLNLMLVNLSGRNYGHYYQSILPTLVIGSTLLLYKVSKELRLRTGTNGLALGLAGVLGAMLLGWALQMVSLTMPDLEHLRMLAQPDTYHQVEHDGIADVIQINSESDDRVLIWDSEVSINFLSGRQSPSRYSSSLYITLPGAESQVRFEEFLESLRMFPPRFIVFQYASESSAPSDFEAEVLCSGCVEVTLQYFEQFRGFVSQNYTDFGSYGDWFLLSLDE